MRACAHSEDANAWQEFVRRLKRPIAAAVVRVGRRRGPVPPHMADDLVQETFLKICRQQPLMSGELRVENEATISAWVKVVATNVAMDHFKAMRSQKRGSGSAAAEWDDELAALACDDGSTLEHRVLLQQLDALLCEENLGTNHERDRAIFWLYYRQGFSARDIAADPRFGLTAKGVESTIARVTRVARERMGGNWSRRGSRTTRTGPAYLRPAEA